MKFAEINKIYTQKVIEYLNKGYVINCGSLSGHQGEIAKVDLTDGKEIIRIYMEKSYISTLYNEAEAIVLYVGKSTDDVEPNQNDGWGTIWNSKLEILSKDVFYQLGSRGSSRGSDWYGTLDEAKACEKLRYERYRNREITVNNNQEITDTKRIQIVSSFLKRRIGLDSINPKKVKFYRSGNNYIAEYTYYNRTHRHVLK